jgi:hypothetical protein
MVYNTTQHPPPPPPPPQQHTVCTVRLLWEGGGGVGQVRKKVEGQQFTREVENANMTYCISSLKLY